MSLRFMALLVSVALALGQGSPLFPNVAQSSGQQTAKAAEHSVVFFVTVKAPDGHTVLDLRKEEFRLRDDGQEKEIADFSLERTWPLVVGLVFDLSGSRRYQLAGSEEKPAAELLRRVLTAQDLGLVAWFQDDVFVQQDLTADSNRLGRAIREAMAEPLRGSSGLFDAIYELCGKFPKEVGGRKALVVVIDGEDNASRHTVDDAIEAALRSSTALYIICLPGPPYRKAGDMKRSRKVAERLAMETGGTIAFVSKREEMADAFQQIGQEIRGQYMLRFSPGGADNKKQWREIQIEVTRPGLRVIAPKGYCAPKN